MKCPWGDHELETVSDVAERNVDHYGGTAAIKTSCCGNIVCIQRKPGYTAFKSGKTTDDWGNKAHPK